MSATIATVPMVTRTALMTSERAAGVISALPFGDGSTATRVDDRSRHGPNAMPCHTAPDECASEGLRRGRVQPSDGQDCAVRTGRRGDERARHGRRERPIRALRRDQGVEEVVLPGTRRDLDLKP
jgi:hypothetical protein